jgi:hypothetical protein
MGFVILAVLFASRADADPIAVGDIVSLHTTESDGTTELARFGGGGAFRMDLAGAAADIIVFCLEVDEFFQVGEDLMVGGLTHQAVRGGANTNAGDPIRGTTAFLYTQFRAGHAAYLNSQVIQEAIWFLEHETASASAAALALIALAGTDMASRGWTDADLGNVRVANLYRGANFDTFAQDMLVLVPEPATLLLLGLGLGLGVLTRVRTRTHARRMP